MGSSDPHPRLTAPLRSVPAELHTLRYIQTAMTDPGPGLPWYVDVGYVDGELFVHYNSTARRAVPRTEWMAAKADQQYWDRETQIGQRNERSVNVSLDTLQERYNQTGGEHGRGRGSVGVGWAPWRSAAHTPQAWPCPAAPSRGCPSQPHRARGAASRGDPNPSPLQWEPRSRRGPSPPARLCFRVSHGAVDVRL